MDALRMAVDSLSLVNAGGSELSREDGLARAAGLVARIPVIVATYWRLLHDEDPVSPQTELGQAASFLYLLTGQEPEPAVARGLETYLNSVVDHGMNASTFTARVITATRSDMVSALVGAIGALKGPLHGGAPGPALDSVLNLRQQSQSSGRPLAEVTEQWARQTIGAGERIMGFGHRVYRVRDPRAEVLGQAAAELFEGAADAALYADAQIVERVILEVLAELKPGRRLQTNVEFYTALLLHGVGLQPELFSSVFAMGRVGGWTAHILEQREEGVLIRPRSVYGGEQGRVWKDLADRG
jgi:citrate synthase